MDILYRTIWKVGGVPLPIHPSGGWEIRNIPNPLDSRVASRSPHCPRAPRSPTPSPVLTRSSRLVD